ncbi:carboxypeptidase-like regulatory domain-containing protein [uncultured Lacinutrix sp.]|uniref:carboxypeptidase-like regulatory domain-containing protein n=1 Tax=uncultured Lacinutrix sp. TaxID=574032 RepID=UPI00261968C1|nr:carboxypeptidase-like regulatory domain-containing protein [uncultured Lacinutrix sp.]
MKSIKNIILLVLLFSIAACENDNNVPINETTEQGDVNPFLENFGADIQARFIGTVVNEQNNPVVGAEISIGTESTTTDSNGVFSILDATVYEKFAYITVSKDGFIDGSRSLVPTAGVNQVKIMLLSIEPTAVIISGQPLTIDLPDGAEVELPGDFQNELGQPYQGNISVTVRSLSVDDENMPLQMPGALLAENATGDLRVLETYGMLSVELRGDNGEELTIASGSTATIRIPVVSTITNPPATIPLWYFDEDNGYWKEEGMATLDGNRYVGDVSHFSFWNCDAPFETIDFCVTMVDENNVPLTNTLVQITTDIATWSPTTSGWTNSDGLVCGLLPANESLVLTVPDYGCVNNNFTTTIGPFSDNQNITITVVDSTALTTTLTATLNDCNGDPITNGYLQLLYNGQFSTIPVVDGMFSSVINYCASDTTYSIQLVDVANGQSSDVISGNFISPTTDLGSQMSCNTLGDADSDGVLDIDEDINSDFNFDNDDTDNDGTPDYLDIDDDGDGVNTIDEDYDNDGNPMNEDSDGDNIPDYLDSQDVQVLLLEIPNTSGCLPSLVYDFNIMVSQYYNPAFINNTYVFYLTQADANADINALVSPFTISTSPQTIFVRATNSITNETAVVDVLLIQEDLDSDNDGLTDCEETTGVDSSSTVCNPNGNITNPNNDDSDNDGFNDCQEAIAGTDPNDDMSIPTIPTLTITVSNSVVEGSSFNYQFNIDTPALDLIQVDFQIVNGSTSNDDFELQSFSMFIEQGDTVANTVTILATDDILIEGDETFTLEGTIIQGTLNAVTPVAGIINDND